MKNLIAPLFMLSLVFSSCDVEVNSEVDLIVHNAIIYTADSVFTTSEAMAIDNGVVVEVGAENRILNNYKSQRRLDAVGKAIYPGFIDSHCHFVYYGLSENEIDLKKTSSWQECIELVKKESKNLPNGWLVGRGWDQNDWAVKEFPDNTTLNELFPDRPVFLERIDGHAAIANSRALELGGILSASDVVGGEIVESNGALTGLLIDNAMKPVVDARPGPDEAELRRAILRAQEDCFSVGLTTVDDAGLDIHVIELVDKMHREATLKMRMYAMINPNKESRKFMDDNAGGLMTDRLTVRSVKLYGDGALGSRGAALKHHYHDAPESSGEMLHERQFYSEWAGLCGVYGFQLNTHCIGDKAVQVLLDVYKDHLTKDGIAVLKNPDHRWRIEHAQVVTGGDMDLFGRFRVIPSVQPTHATSDMTWAEDRLGPERIEGAYAYKSLLAQNGSIALGTDFPVEGINPLNTFYAAVFRKDHSGMPKEGWRVGESLSRKEALLGMTTWGALANFEEDVKGSLSKGRVADFVILDRDIMTIGESDILKTKVEQTWIAGERVY